jgi:hypothetical protein
LVELNGNTAEAFAGFSRGMRSLDDAVSLAPLDGSKADTVVIAPST